MKESILKGKRILGIDGEPQVLKVVEEEISKVCSNCVFDKATHYKEAVEMMVSWTYDLIILGDIGVRSIDLWTLAVTRNFHVVMLIPHGLNPEFSGESTGVETPPCFYKGEPNGIIPFLEDVLRHENLSLWGCLFENLRTFVNNHLSSWKFAGHPPMHLLKSRYGTPCII